MNTSGKPVPVWDNVLLRTTLYYLVIGVASYWADGISVGGIGSQGGFETLTVLSSKKDLVKAASDTGPAADASHHRSESHIGTQQPDAGSSAIQDQLCRSSVARGRATHT